VLTIYFLNNHAETMASRDHTEIRPSVTNMRRVGKQAADLKL